MEFQNIPWKNVTFPPFLILFIFYSLGEQIFAKGIQVLYVKEMQRWSRHSGLWAYLIICCSLPSSQAVWSLPPRLSRPSPEPSSPGLPLSPTLQSQVRESKGSSCLWSAVGPQPRLVSVLPDSWWVNVCPSHTAEAAGKRGGWPGPAPQPSWAGAALGAVPVSCMQAVSLRVWIQLSEECVQRSQQPLHRALSAGLLQTLSALGCSRRPP